MSAKEAAERVEEYLNRREEIKASAKRNSPVIDTWATGERLLDDDLRALLEERREAVELLRDCACCMSPLSLRIKVKDFLAKLDGEGN